MAARKKAEFPNLGRRPEEFYRTCEAVLEARAWFAGEIKSLEGAATISADEGDMDGALRLADDANLFRAVRARFEAQMVTDPRKALTDLDLWRQTARADIRGAATTTAPTRDVCLAVSVMALQAWQEDEMRIYAELALHYLEPISGVRTHEDVKRLAQDKRVLEAYKHGSGFAGGGNQAMAIALVDVATGAGVQTIKRALSAWRRYQRSKKRP